MNNRITRKQFLIEESELNRIRLMEDFSSLSKELHQLTESVFSFKAVAASAALLVTGLTVVQRSKQISAPGKGSWLKTIVNGVGLASTVWLALKSPRSGKGVD